MVTDNDNFHLAKGMRNSVVELCYFLFAFIVLIHCIYEHLDVTIGFEQEVYTVRENDNTVSVCAVVLEGELEREVAMVVTTQSNNATGWLNDLFILVLCMH